MQLITVKSTMVHAVGYDDQTKELEVVFVSGGAYRYVDVDRSTFEALLQAESIGRYMHAHVIGEYAEYEVTGRRKR